MAITSNIYPPVVNDTMPAFIRTTSCKIYFSLSIYNSVDDINTKAVQVSLINQRTNASALKTSLYPSGIKLATMYLDNNVTNDYNYYIEINPNDLEPEDGAETGVFGLNQFYKVQLRFTAAAASNPPSTGTELNTWLYENRAYFSEWSKVCLIKGIEQPIIVLRGFDNNIKSDQETLFTTPMINVIGEYTYAEKTIETEYLKSYNIKIYQSNNKENPIYTSEEIYTNQYNPNEINHELLYDLLDGINYTMIFTYTTNNLYTESLIYTFTIIQYGIDKLNANIFATADQENGRIKIDIVTKDATQKFLGNLTIRRTSSESNFHKWEDVKTIVFSTGTELNYSWYDTTVQSGIWYKYCAQKRNTYGDRGAIIQIDNPVICVFDDIFIGNGDCQLKIKFNLMLNEFKYNVTESQQVTMGSKYPYIKRNGNNFFRSFPIGGLISSFVDTSNWYDPHFYDGEFHPEDNELKIFTSKSDIYGESKQLYENYNTLHNINEYNDFIYEREFRKKVYDFLYKYDIKLFRSTTEGNILIKLMNIDFQPVQSLGRRLYSFTATAVQVDEATIANYDKYKIQTIGDYEKYINYTHEILGQIQGTFNENDDNIIITKIDSKYKKLANKGFINNIDSLKWLRLEIESEPYVIINDNSGALIKADMTSSFDATNATVGYIIEINDKEIILFPKIVRRAIGDLSNSSVNTEIIHLGIFELKENNTEIISLKFKYPTTATIDYIANLNEVEDTSGFTSRIYYSRKPGQLYGTFNPSDSLIQKIYNKYAFEHKNYYKRLLDVNDIQVEGTPGTVIYVKDSKDEDFNRHVLENGYLQLKHDDINIEGLYFCGIHLTECKNPLEISTVNRLTEEDFVLQSQIYDNINEIENPVNGNIYQIRAYGLKSGAFMQTNRILAVDEENTEYTIITPDTYYKLLVESIEDDDNLKFVYYYGSWYLLKDVHQKTKLLKGDIRQLRDNEYIITNERYDSFEDIENPLPNGVYQFNSYVINESNILEQTDTKLTIPESANLVYQKADNNYVLYLLQSYEEASSRFIYYHGKWYPFTINHDVLCPVDGIVNYTCEVMKGVY